MIFHNSYNILLNTLRVGYLSKHQFVHVPYNSKILRLLKKLMQIRYISCYSILDDRKLRIYLVYNNNNLPNFRFTKLFYKPSHRTYISYKRLIILYKYDYGITFILSTSLGLLTHTEAIGLKVGGEMICALYS